MSSKNYFEYIYKQTSFSNFNIKVIIEEANSVSISETLNLDLYHCFHPSD